MCFKSALTIRKWWRCLFTNSAPKRFFIRQFPLTPAERPLFNRGMGTDIFNTDSGRKFLALIKAVFKVSDLISDLVIREKIKKQNLKIYENFISSGGGNNHSDLLKNIDVLRGF